MPLRQTLYIDVALSGFTACQWNKMRSVPPIQDTAKFTCIVRNSWRGYSFEKKVDVYTNMQPQNLNNQYFSVETKLNQQRNFNILWPLKSDSVSYGDNSYGSIRISLRRLRKGKTKHTLGR